jgi:glycosyltransferase involved in cell wall biosynthesis
MARQHVVIDWPLTPYTGWGNYGIQLTQALLQRGRETPLPAYSNDHTRFCDPLWLTRLQELERQAAALREQLAGLPAGAQLATSARLCVSPLGNAIERPRLQARHQVGVTFFECSQFAPRHHHNLQSYDLVVAGSHWNAQLLQQLGPTPVELVHQGIDASRFNPIPVPQLLQRSLVIFSGGKLEARKGQDIVLAAFRELLRSHPDAVLIVAWGNVGGVALSTIADMPHAQGVPAAPTSVGLAHWIEGQGIPTANLVVLPPLVNVQLPNLIKQADVAVFASRCEGGTNLMAMETLACGVPTVLSANTGHLDLLELGLPHALGVGAGGLGQVSGLITRPYGGDPLGLWGETEPAEIADLWRRIAADKATWRQRGLQGAPAFGERFSWGASMARLLSLLQQRGLLDPA